MNFKRIVSITSTILLVSGIRPCDGFSTTLTWSPKAQKQSRTQRAVVVDPSSFITNVADFQHSASESAHHLEALASTIYSTGVAHGHSNPWFGPPDPYLEAGKSIAPLQSTISEPASITATTTTTTTTLPQNVQDMIAKGYTVIDASTVKYQQKVPGIVLPSRIFLGRPTAPNDYLATFLAKAEWASNFVNVFDKLALASFVYCLVEFFYLRPNIDLYKAEIEEESPASLWADVLATFTVRFVAMGFVALLTLAVFQ
ncbi:hypothetical protein ACA910_017729 [Epithemia clementina (nom. ined.)]